MIDRTHARALSRLLEIALALTSVLVWESTARAGVRRYPIDQLEVDSMRTQSPEALALLEQGEALGVSGKVEEADALFRQGLALYKLGSLLQRRHCQALTVLGHRVEASTACYRALQESRSNANVRASVRAWVSGPEAPSMTDVGMALDLAGKSMNLAPGQFTPIAALCDIGASLGDGIMLQRCASDLERVAPQAPETRRARALLSSLCPPLRFWAGWTAIVTLLGATVGHALWRWTRRTARRAGTTAALVGSMLAAALSMVTVPAGAEAEPTHQGMLSKWPVNDDAPEKSLPSEKEREKDPLEFGYWLQDVIMRAEMHSKHGQHDVAARLYTALAKAVPERAISYTKLCDEYEAMGDFTKAVASCGEALLHEGLMVKDYEHYVHLVLAKPGPLAETQVKALANVLAHMKEDPAGGQAVAELECEVGVRTSNIAELEACTANLAKTAPKSAKTITYQWSLAMLRGKLDEAKQLLDQGSLAGMTGLEDMRMAMESAARAKHRYRVVLWSIAAAFALAALGVLLTAGLRRRATPRAAA